MEFDLIQRRGATDVVTLAHWTRHFDPNPSLEVELYRLSQPALGTMDFTDGDQLIFRYTIDAPQFATCWEPNGDGPSGRDDHQSQIPHFALPQ